MGSGFARKKKEGKALQEQLANMQRQMESMRVEGEAGNGLVKITLTGARDMVSIKIDPQCVDPEDVEGLELLVKSAYEAACKKLEESNPMGSLSGFGF